MLAGECPDSYARDALNELAAEFGDMARTLETEESARLAASRAREREPAPRQPASY
jgi:hypothetical protein